VPLNDEEVITTADGRTYELRELTTTIESAKPIPVGEYIPREFSQAYVEFDNDPVLAAEQRIRKLMNEHDITMTVSKV
jgi:hypothetical protein